MYYQFILTSLIGILQDSSRPLSAHLVYSLIACPHFVPSVEPAAGTLSVYDRQLIISGVGMANSPCNHSYPVPLVH